MNYKKLGRSGLDVSPICMGCMSLGQTGSDFGPWVIDYEAAKPLVKQALDLGINFFDTANVYSGGTSEEIIGRLLKEMGRRDEIVLATKVFAPMRQGPNAGGLSRKAIFAETDNCLRRLQTDYIDLLQIHRWDPATPIEETLEALHDIVKAGKARYIGASTMYSWQFAQALAIAERHGWTRFVSMQNHLNLLYREEEREMLPLCAAEGIGVIPWSPLARGKLARPWDTETERSATDAYTSYFYNKMSEADHVIVDRVVEVAKARGVPQAQLALAWLMRKPGVTAPIVGVSKPRHLEDAMAALSLELDASEISALEELYVPHPVSGFF